jgi:hypothetical protein
MDTIRQPQSLGDEDNPDVLLLLGPFGEIYYINNIKAKTLLQSTVQPRSSRSLVYEHDSLIVCSTSSDVAASGLPSARVRIGLSSLCKKLGY